MQSLRLLVILIPVVLALIGCTSFRVANASLQSKADFFACTPDRRVSCEPGSELLASSVAPMLDEAIAAIEESQFNKFTEAVLIYTYAGFSSFSAHSGADKYAVGAVSLGRLNLSPKLLEVPERTQGILRHELSHLHLQSRIGTLAWARIPSWFHEGLATLNSNGGGAETVTADEAIKELRTGKRFDPDESQWTLFPKSAASYGLKPHMYYRQASLFVGFMRQKDPPAFQKLIEAIQDKATFGDAVKSAYGKSIFALWNDFLGEVGANLALGLGYHH